MKRSELWTEEDESIWGEEDEEYEDNDDENFVKTMSNFYIEKKERSKELIHKYLYISKIKSGNEVVALLEELKNDKSFDRCWGDNIIIDAFKEDRLYWLQVEKNKETWPRWGSNTRDKNISDDDTDSENEDTYDDDDLDSSFFLPEKYFTDWNIIPCFCMVGEKDKTICEIIWVHPAVRKNGFGRRLIELLGITYAEIIPEDSHEFWEKIGITYPTTDLSRNHNFIL